MSPDTSSGVLGDEGPLTVACKPCGWERSRPKHAWAIRSLMRHGRRHHPHQVPTTWAYAYPSDEVGAP